MVILPNRTAGSFYFRGTHAWGRVVVRLNSIATGNSCDRNVLVVAAETDVGAVADLYGLILFPFRAQALKEVVIPRAEFNV